VENPGNKILLLALTGFGDTETEERALAAHFAERLVKPLDFGHLQRVIGRAFSSEPGGGSTKSPNSGQG
jgi:hypothetical protein